MQRCKSQAARRWWKALPEKSAFLETENTLACCVKRGHRQFLSRQISLSQSEPLRFALQIRRRHSNKSCSSSRRSRLHFLLEFTQAQLLIQALDSENAYRFNRMQSSRLAQRLAMTRSLVRGATSGM